MLIRRRVTLILLTRAFRLIFLAVKAVILNLLSPPLRDSSSLPAGSRFGVDLNVHLTDAIMPDPADDLRVPLRASMDYEVFMVSP
jgi:hypothetical protein